ncbi:MAG: UDP-N-acetylglucosamine 2-epimerase (non-hydrolyzing) [Actinomycetota bacterium]
MKVLSVFGTRPEGIKMAPVVRALEASDGIDSVVCTTGQHREMLQQVVDLFDLRIDHDLAIMTAGQSLTDITSAVLQGLEAVLHEVRPDWVLVHGDTTTSMAAALAAYYQQVPVGHVEAGLRTRNIYSPWPEEINRSITGRIAAAHFAPTIGAQQNLIDEAVPDSQVVVTGNTVIDALHWVRDNALTTGGIEASLARTMPFLEPSKRLLLVTGHRRESFDGGLERMCRALARLAGRGDVQIVYPVHLNPIVQQAAGSILRGVAGVHLVAPLDYLPFVWLMTRAHLIISDSGGVQEEAPSLGVPVLVTRETTERPEAIEAGVVELVGTDEDLIVARAERLLDDPAAYAQMTRADSPYGDGLAAGRIAAHLLGRQS